MVDDVFEQHFCGGSLLAADKTASTGRRIQREFAQRERDGSRVEGAFARGDGLDGGP